MRLEGTTATYVAVTIQGLDLNVRLGHWLGVFIEDRLVFEDSFMPHLFLFFEETKIVLHKASHSEILYSLGVNWNEIYVCSVDKLW